MTGSTTRPGRHDGFAQLRTTTRAAATTLLATLMLAACSTPTPQRTADSAPPAAAVSPASAAAPAATPASAATPAADGTIPPFPAGFDYPATAALDAAIAANDSARLREHGWWLWAGLNVVDETGDPLWWAWPTSTQAFAPDASGLGSTQDDAQKRAKKHLIAANAANTPINLDAPYYPVPTVSDGTCKTGTSTTLPDGDQFQANGDILIAGVIYDEGAYDWIRSQGLYKASTLTTQWGQGSGAPSIAPFPSSSIVLKHMYWPVKNGDLTALPVWDAPATVKDPASYIGYERWDRVVIVDATGEPVRPGMTGVDNYLFHIFEHDKTTALGPILGTGTVVSINDFYHRRIGQAEWDAMSANDQGILNASACWLYDRPFEPGDVLISVAMHIITREIDRWALQSVWWHDRPNAGPFAADRPKIPESQAPGPWDHYLMTIEYGLETAPGMLPVSYNPYIELAAAHPIATNCRNCHSRAAWPSGFNPAAPPAPITASYQAVPGPGPLVDLQPSDPVFDKLLLLDFQWAVSDRAE